MNYKPCPRCAMKGWYRPAKAPPRHRRCRFCGHDNRVDVAANELHATLDRGHKSLKRTLDKARND